MSKDEKVQYISDLFDKFMNVEYDYLTSYDQNELIVAMDNMAEAYLGGDYE